MLVIKNSPVMLKKQSPPMRAIIPSNYSTIQMYNDESAYIVEAH